MKFELYNEIVFNQDILEYSIKKGDIGTLVEFYHSNNSNIEDGFSVEIFDVYGETLKVVTVTESKISNFKHNSVLAVREIELV